MLNVYLTPDMAANKYSLTVPAAVMLPHTDDLYASTYGVHVPPESELV